MAESTDPAPAALPAMPHDGAATLGSASSRPGRGRKTVGTAVAAVTLAAMTALGGPTLVGGSAASLDPGSIIGSPPNSASSRIAGVDDDMARAVALEQITPEQAAFLKNQLVRRIQTDV